MRGDIHAQRRGYIRVISIHSPRMRGDAIDPIGSDILDISIHSPRMRGDVGGKAT